MSRPDPLAGLGDENTRRIAREAIKSGAWEWAGMAGSSHGQLRHKNTGQIVTFSSSPRVASWKSFATELQSISPDVTVWRKGNRKKSRKRIEVSRLDLRPTFAESKAMQEADRLARDCEELDRIIRALVLKGGRDAALKARPLIAKRVACEERLASLHHPAPSRLWESA